MNSKNDIGSLCRIKVNKMLSSLNSKNNDFFIPKYTISNKNEEKYSYLNKSKGCPIKTNHNNFSNMNMKRKMSSNNITTTEENYNKQPIDFIINHGVLVYQRNLKGEEVLNFGINNKYLRKKDFNMVKNDKTLYPVGSFYKDKTDMINKTHSNFKHLSNNSSKVDLSNKKQLKLNKSKKSFASMSDIPLSKYKNKNSSSRQKKNGLNLNNTHSSISSFNSINAKKFVVSSKNKNIIDKNKGNSKLNSKNTKKVINFVRKKKKNNENQNNFLLIRKKKNNSIIENDENKMLNNNTDIKSIRDIRDNKILNKTKDNKFNTNYIIKKDKIQKEIIKIIPQKNDVYDINQGLAKLFNIINIIKNQYIKIYLQILKDNLPKKIDNKVENENTINVKINNLKNKIDNIDITKLLIEKCKKINYYQNTFFKQNNKKSNSIIVAKKLSSSTLSPKELQKNNSNSNLSFLISKNYKFFSKENLNYNKKDSGKSELYRDSKSLQKKYEEICRRKKRQMSMTFSTRFNHSKTRTGAESYRSNNLSETNRTNNFSNIYDNNSNKSLQIKNINKFNQIFYKDSPMKNINNNEKRKNFTENKKDKNIFKIKLIKRNNIDKKVLSYKIEKKIPKNINNNKSLREKHYSFNSSYTIKNNYHIIKNKDYDYGNNLNNKKSFNSNDNNIIRNNYTNEANKNLMKKVFIHKRKNYYIEDKNINNNLKIKEKSLNKGNIISSINNNYNIKNISLLIKNICTKDKRIFIRITYIPYLKTNIINNYNNKLLKIEKIINYKYIPNNKKIKNIIKRKNNFEKKLSLIREEDEKSKYLKSTKSINKIEEELNTNNNNIIVNTTKIIFSLEKYIRIAYIKEIKQLFFNLKIIYLVSSIKNIINIKMKDTNFIKYFKRKNKDKINAIYNPIIKKDNNK